MKRAIVSLLVVIFAAVAQAQLVSKAVLGLFRAYLLRQGRVF